MRLYKLHQDKLIHDIAELLLNRDIPIDEYEELQFDGEIPIHAITELQLSLGYLTSLYVRTPFFCSETISR